MKPNRIFPNTAARRCGDNAFALVIALLVLALLVVTIVGSSLMLQVEVRTADNSRQITEARQNALYGLGIALGELQQLAGPDQRVTATGSLTRDAAGTQWEPANVATNSPHRNWTGVWDTSAPRFIPDPSTPRKVVSNVGTATGQLNPEPLAWLVSGGKNRKTSSGNGTQTSDVTPDTYPARVSTTGKPTSVTTQDDHVVLLGNGTVDLAAHPEDGIVVPKVAIMKQNSDGSANKSGAYGYWVADEGVKARFDAVESEAFAGKTAAEQKDYRALGAQRIGAEQISTGSGNATFSSIGYDPKDAGFLKKLRNLAARDQIGFLDAPASGNSTFRPAARTRFHDITIVSEGVLSDTRKGGLKQDLTVYLQGNGTISLNGTSLIADTDLLFSDSRDTTGVTDPKNPRAPLATRYPGLSLTSNSTGLPKFGLLRTWYQLSSLSPTIQPQTATQHGLFPVVVRCEWPIWVNVNLDLEHFTGNYTVPYSALVPRVYPTVTLWNPYNADLPAQEYLVEIPIGSNGRFAFVTNSPTQVMSGPTTSDPLYYALPSTIRLRIPASEGAIPAGETRIYTLAQDYTAGNATMDMVSAYFTVQYQGLNEPPPNFTKTGLGLRPKGINQNFSFGLGDPTGPHLVVTAEPSGTSDYTTWFGVSAYYYGNPSRRIVRLYQGAGGSLLQELNPSPKNYGWMNSVSAGGTINDMNWVNGSKSTYIKFNQAPIPFAFDTRNPQRTWQVRPLSHYTSGAASSNWTGGSFAPMLDFNYRAGVVGSPPNKDVGGREETRWGGPYRVFPDGNKDDTIGLLQNQFSFGGSPASERFFYAYQDTLFQDASNSSGNLTSSVFKSGPASSLGRKAPLFSLRHPGRELISPGYLQHLNIGSYVWNPSYAVGNSWVNPQLAGRDCYSGFFTAAPSDAIPAQENRVYDLSYIANDSLWDRFFLSTANSTVTASASLLENKSSLPNSRLRFRSLNGGNYTSLVSSADKFELGSEYLTINGAFNINSTAVEAWCAFLSSNAGIEINSSPAGSNEVVFARMYNSGNGTGEFLATPTGAQPAAETAAAYTGARKLSTQEIRLLAEMIVEQVKLRGPFSSLADFVNRRLVSEPSSSANETAVSRTGFVGPLQSAIDSASETSGIINSMFYNSTLPGSFFQAGKIPANPVAEPYTRLVGVDDVPLANLRGFYVPRLRMLGKTWYYSAAGVPGFLTQADIFSSLGHLMSARSDTFTIRTYGEVTDKSGKILSKAWCEAVVQRLPAPVKSSPSRAEQIWPESSANVAADRTNALGRKFVVKSFRWLTPEEI